jgi:gamma-glutamyltranspeptidase / glutathione hydrolase
MALLEMLNILEQFPAKIGGEGSSESRHLMIEAMRRAFRDRAAFAADPAFHAVPVAQLVSKRHAVEVARDIRTGRATANTEVPARSEEDPDESFDTTHFTVIDGAGNVVTNTYTLNGFYGSQVIPKGTGVLLNDIMVGFSTRPGSARRRGSGEAARCLP